MLPGGQNLSALSTRLATARSNSSTSSSAAARRRLPPSLAAAQAHALARRALGEAQRDVVEQFADVDRLGCRSNSGSSSLARSPSDCTMPRRVARVAQRHLDQLAVLGAAPHRPSARPASPGRRPLPSAASAGRATGCSRLRAGSGRGGEARSTGAGNVEQHLERAVELAELVARRRRQRAARRDRRGLRQAACDSARPPR